MTRTLRSLALAMLLSLSVHAAQAAQTPRNVIVLIGDGMGVAQTTLARLSLGKPDSELSMDSMRYAAFVKTHSVGVDGGRTVITDSAAAATALSSGHKTRNGMIATLPNGKPVRTILEAAAASGRSTGLVTTVTITHATPAGFGAHVSSRGDESDIAVQYIEKKIDVLMGGGECFFLPKSATGSKRKDERDLLKEAGSAGYTLARTRQELASAKPGRLLGLFSMSYMTTKAPEPSLAEMTDKALSVLAKRGKGFFLMVEAGQIDSAGHGNDGPNAVKQTLDFDAAIDVALKFARKRGDTLVIVTADHETGGLSIVGPAAGTTADFGLAWGTKGHSGIVVPLLADGPGAERFSGVLDNTVIPRRIAQLWRVKLD